MSLRLSEQVALERIKSKIPDYIDTSKVKYVNMKTPVILTCKFHGDQLYTPNAIMNGCFCKQCSSIKKGQSQTLTTDDFKKKVKDIYGELYTVTGEYITAKTPIEFFCNKHKKIFFKTPNNFMKGEVCEFCQYEKRHNGELPKASYAKKKTARRLTKEEIAERVDKLYDVKYDLYRFLDSSFVYKNNKQIIEIGCPIHKIFFKKQINNLLNGQGCPLCSNEKRNRTVTNTESFIKKAKAIWGNLYDYSETDYKSTNIPIVVKCNKCGHKFTVSPNNHTNKTHPRGCPYCNHPHQAKTNADFINEIETKFPDKFDTSKVEYIGREKEVTMICKKCGQEITRKAKYFLEGHGCPKCSFEEQLKKQRKPFSVFKQEIDKLYNNSYIIDESTYINAKTPVKITCKIHNKDFWKTPHKLLQGDGCPICHESKLEREIRNILIDSNVNFIAQCNSKTFSWLSTGKYSSLSFDFYLPDYKIAIECQGKQHFQPSDFFGGKEAFKIQQERDKLKKSLCEKHGVKLLYFTHYDKIDESNNIIKNKEKLLKKIYE